MAEKRDRTEYFRDYRRKNAEKLAEYQREYRARNREKLAFNALNYYLRKAKENVSHDETDADEA